MATPDLVAARWRISGNNGTCVGVAQLPDGRVAVRNSNRPEDGVLLLTRADMRSWIAGVKAGEFDDLS